MTASQSMLIRVNQVDYFDDVLVALFSYKKGMLIPSNWVGLLQTGLQDATLLPSQAKSAV